MARTLIGQLILRLRAEGLGEANKVRAALDNVERTVKRMSGTGVGSWGVGFQKQINALKLSAGELRDVERSWINLHDTIKKNGMDKALGRSTISHWKTNTIADLAQARGDWDRHYAAIERNTKAHAARMQGLMKPLFVSLGFYTGAYGGGLMIRGGFTAASEERRQMAEAKFAGLSEEERGKIDARANELASQYRLPKSLVLESLKDSTLNLPSVDEAIAVSDAKARALLVLANSLDGGASAAVDGLRRFDKAMDNIEKITPDEYLRMLEGFIKAQQVIGKELDPGAFEQAIKYARTAGKVHSEEFLTMWLPLLIAQIGGSNAGVQVRGLFDQMVVGRATKSSLARQRELGLRDDNGIIGQDLYGQNPIKWIYEYLLPALEKSGIDITDETELAKTIGEITNNRNVSDIISSAILNMAQWKRLIEERLPNASGLAAADEVQKLNPFAAWEGFKSSLENLASAILPMNEVAAALNALADGTNKLAAEARNNPLMAALGIGAGVGGAAYGGKKAFDLLSGGFGLSKSAVALDGSAAALTRAAVALGGASVADLPTGGNGRGRGRPRRIPGAGKIAGTAGLTGVVSTGVALLAGPERAEELQEEANQRSLNYQKKLDEILDWMFAQLPKPSTPPPPNPDGSLAGTGQSLIGLGAPVIGFSAEQIEEAKRKVAEAGRDMKESLTVTAKPDVDTSALAGAVALARQLEAILQRIGSLAQSANASVGTELRRNMAD